MKIQTTGLGKRYNREWIFRDASLTFEDNQVYGVIGANGAGKSTLLRVLWGQLPPSTGQVAYLKDGAEVDQESWFQQLSIAAPYMELVEEFTLTELIRFHFHFKPMLLETSTEALIQRMELTASRHKHFRDFSSGMKQRVKLGLALFSATEVLFLDEPTTNLDELAMQWYRHQLDQVKANRLVIIASNNPGDFPAGTSMMDVTHLKRLQPAPGGN